MIEDVSLLFNKFFQSEKASGFVLIFCMLISIILANTAFSDSYISFWNLHIGSDANGLHLDHSIVHWINDGLMTIFFLLVGLEIERELYIGELHPIKNAILPVGAAIGGMLIPALIYLSLNINTSMASGFGIPMGTDIAFALAILSLAGSRVPVAIKILLTAIAIIDDLGAILIIALFYGNEIHLVFLAASIGIFALLLLLNRMNVNTLWLYLIPGIVMWYCMMESGIHPTIAGVLLAFAIPFRDGSAKSPSYILQHFLHRPVAFIVLPLFVLANTAIPIKTEFLNSLTGSHAIGIGLGLFFGKPMGILIACWLLFKMKIVSMPANVKWNHLLGMGCMAGIGFTMSIFITKLAFDDEVHIQSSKMMILIASLCAGLVGYLILGMKKRSNQN
ncbi:MAG: Na+/H+ antiporter NhaA [Chitinophagales bacterium]|nr:Na+/H+ antiporter NhaA [Chitinophagales bacterium]